MLRLQGPKMAKQHKIQKIKTRLIPRWVAKSHRYLQQRLKCHIGMLSHPCTRYVLSVQDLPHTERGARDIGVKDIGLVPALLI